MHVETLSLPLISSGIYGGSKHRALKAAVDTIGGFLPKIDTTVYPVIFDKQSLEIGGRPFKDISQYIGEDYHGRKRAFENSVAIFFPFDYNEHGCEHEGHKLRNNNREPNAVNAPNERKKQNGGDLKDQCTKKRDQRGGEAVV